MKLRHLPTAMCHSVAAKWREQHLQGSALATYQNRRAERMVTFAQQHSPFYREQWQGHRAATWQTLPTIDKTLMMANFAACNRYGISRESALRSAQAAEQDPTLPPLFCTPQGQAIKGQARQGHEIIAGLSSGTSGERGLFLITEAEIAMWAGVILARALHQISWRGERVAFFLRAFSKLYSGVNNPFLQLHYFALTEPLAELCTALNHLQPTIVIGPPSLLATLADARATGQLRITPARLIAVAEVIEPQDERALRDCFGVPVHQIYQCTEGLLGISCRHGKLHIQEDLVVLQMETISSPIHLPFALRENRSTAATAGPHTISRHTPILTDLWRTTQPMIRYRLGDLLDLAQEPCPCGSPFRVIHAIEGRVADLLYFTEQETGKAIPLFPSIARQIMLGASPAIRDYQVVQYADGTLQIHLATDPGADFVAVADSVETALTSTLTTSGCQAPVVTVQAGIPHRPADLKRRRIQRVDFAGSI